MPGCCGDVNRACARCMRAACWAFCMHGRLVKSGLLGKPASSSLGAEHALPIPAPNLQAADGPAAALPAEALLPHQHPSQLGSFGGPGAAAGPELGSGFGAGASLGAVPRQEKIGVESVYHVQAVSILEEAIIRCGHNKTSLTWPMCAVSPGCAVGCRFGFAGCGISLALCSPTARCILTNVPPSSPWARVSSQQRGALLQARL